MLDQGRDLESEGYSDLSEGRRDRVGADRASGQMRRGDRLARADRISRRFQPVEELMKRFMSQENGSTTVEFVLWLPLLVAVLIVAVDASVLYMRQSNLWQVSRDTARIVSRHGMTEAVAEAYARNEAMFGDYVPTVDVQVNGQVVTVTMAASLNEIAPIGIFNFALNEDLVASISHAVEPR
jgi:Flp pilus assembly pilin Flp